MFVIRMPRNKKTPSFRSSRRSNKRLLRKQGSGNVIKLSAPANDNSERQGNDTPPKETAA